jgi:quercetin dioxygenase-like cupin family protein
MNYLVEFNKLPWNEPVVGLRYKIFTSGNQQIRLVEFSEGLIELDWCRKGHAGYVLEGTFTTEFYNGNTERYKKGDVVFIPSGEQSKHKAILGKGEKVTLLEFENIEV